MPLVKELLLSCIVMNICLITSRPISPGKLCQLMHSIDFSFSDLKKAEDDYVEIILGSQPSTLESIEGISVGDNSKIQTSICAITHYFERYLLEIVKNNTLDHANHLISTNIRAFKTQFKKAVKDSKVETQTTAAQPVHCSVSLPSTEHEKKITGFKILHFTYNWVTNFTSTKTCNLQQ